jgi:hypothetical protein
VTFPPLDDHVVGQLILHLSQHTPALPLAADVVTRESWSMTQVVSSGRVAARELWHGGVAKAKIDDPLTPEFAADALTELELIQRETPGALREVLEGAQMSAEQLSTESFHGLIEIVQNADDLHASEVRVALRRSLRNDQLLVAHNGERVQLRHVLAMTLAFVSTKRDDPIAKGRFGAGLKTLGRLGTRLTVHSAPYDFSIEGNSVRRAEPTSAIEGFFETGSTDTLLILELREGFDAREFRTWFDGLGVESLLFLDTVRSLRLVDIEKHRALAHHRITHQGMTTVKLTGSDFPCQRSTLRDTKTGRSWQRFAVDWPMPPTLQRRYKASLNAMPIAIAIPGEEEGDAASLYAGLPVAYAPGLTFHANAQFDIDLARQGIQHEDLNKWCFERIAELAASVVLTRFLEHPARAWQVIPLLSDLGTVGDRWLGERIAALVDTVHERVRQSFAIKIGSTTKNLKELAYEDAPIEGLLTQHELDGLRPGMTLLPRSARGTGDRWRDALAALGSAERVDVDDAVALFDWSDDDLGPHDVKWFIKLARAGVEAGLGEEMWLQRCVITAVGERIVPPLPEDEGELLLRQVQDNALATRLGFAHVIDPAYLAHSAAARIVREWLESQGMLRDSADAEATLRALATRDNDPLDVADEELRSIRDAFVLLASDVQAELGPKVGSAILVDVHRWTSGKRVPGKACPAESYLPASLEDRTDGWGKAAGATPGLAWVQTRYGDVLRHVGQRPRRGDPKPLAARSFFGLLGVEVAPRLAKPQREETRYRDPASPIDEDALPESQREALSQLKRYATHLKHDQLSPDLVAVLRNLTKERTQKTRRARARALLNALGREWERLYKPHTEALAVWSSGNWRAAGQIPATWLAFARDEPWLSSENGVRKPPKELAVRTRATEAIYGHDRDRFAYELDESEATSPLVRALGIETDPQVSEMVEHIEAMRESGKQPDEAMIMLRYAAIGAACRRRDLMPDDMVGDMTVRKLRARFGVHPTRPGLVFAGGRWLPPVRARLGAPIFGHRRAFVSERSDAARLWRVLRIPRAGISDCLQVLDEISRLGNPDLADEQILVNTYLYMEAHIGGAARRERAELRTMPVWTGSSWTRSRPVFATSDPHVGVALASQLPVWQLPVAFSSVRGLLKAGEITSLSPDSFDPVVHEHALTTGAAIERQFSAAVELFRDWLTRHDSKLLSCLSTTWEELAQARIVIDPTLQLELHLDRRSGIRVPARAHLTREPITIYVIDSGALGEDDAGGLAIAGLFTAGVDRDKISLAWSRAWARSEQGERGTVALAEDTDDEAELGDLFKQASGKTSVGLKGKKRTNTQKPASGVNERKQAALPVRRLKSLDDFSVKTVEMTDKGDRGASKRSQRRGLRDELGGGGAIGDGQRAPQAAPLAYSDEEKQELALQLLQLAINGHETELRDYRHLRGVGADALDKLRRYFEIKATYGVLPDEVTLTANEAERAFREQDRFYLAIIAGLEQGYETVVRIIPNPLQNLAFKPSTSVTLAGIRDKRRAITIRFGAATAQTGADGAA